MLFRWFKDLIYYRQYNEALQEAVDIWRNNYSREQAKHFATKEKYLRVQKKTVIRAREVGRLRQLNRELLFLVSVSELYKNQLIELDTAIKKKLL